MIVHISHEWTTAGNADVYDGDSARPSFQASSPQLSPG
jgi:hypothetical protein